MMSSGRMPCFSISTTAAPARRQSSFFASEMAFWAELLGRLMPSASMALAMVLAVYMPPQDPGPGNGAGFNGLEFLVVDAPLGVRADGFEHGDDVELALVRR